MVSRNRKLKDSDGVEGNSAEINNEPSTFDKMCRVVLVGFISAIVLIVIITFLKGMNLVDRTSTSQFKLSVGDGISVESSMFNIINASVNSQFTPKVNIPIKKVSSNNLRKPVSNKAEFIKIAKILQERVEGAFQWIITPNGKASFPYLRWDLIANADVHILYKLHLFLNYYLQDESRQQHFYEVFHQGYQCKPLQAAQQELISRFISMDICSEIEWYKLAHLGFPEAQSIFDIGGNKGYLGSLFVALWGGGKINVAPINVFNIATKLDAWKNSKNPAGYCKDGYNYGVALYCPKTSVRTPSSGHCEIGRKELRVISFDGSSYLTKTLTGIMNNHLLTNSSSKGKESSIYRNTWHYYNYAVSNKEGTARFTKQSNERNAGFEGGSIKWTTSSSKEGETPNTLLQETEEVNVTSVDRYMQLNKLSKLDILKIDTEGNDNKVLIGAKNAIQEMLGMFTFEGGGGVTYSKEMSKDFETLGYSCYSTSRAGLFKWSHGCMHDKYFGSFRKKDKGNIFCVHRTRAPIAFLAFEIMSFPAMIDFHFAQLNETTKLSGKDKQLHEALFGSAKEKADQLNYKVDPASLLPIYVNIRGYCSPWPKCISSSN